MEKILGTKWADKAIFLIIAAAIVVSVRYLATSAPGALPKPLGIRVSDWRGDDVSVGPGDRMILYRDRETPVGSAAIVYAGSRQGRLQIGIRIPALDPVYVYRHEIPVDEARSGIRLAGMGVALKTARRGYVEFEVRD